MILGGQAVNRTLNSIRNIGIHYTAALRFITGHERFWSDTRSWDRGGYTFYIDREANIHQNYKYERITYGATGWNATTVHVSIESNSKENYKPDHLIALDFILNKSLKDCPNTLPDRIFVHWKMTNTTACPGWNKAELNNIKARIKKGQSLVSLHVETSNRPQRTLDAVSREVISGVWVRRNESSERSGLRRSRGSAACK